MDALNCIISLGKNSGNTIASILNDTVNTKGNSLKIVATANSVSNNISCEGWINKLLSEKKAEPNPVKISLVI